MKTTLKLSFLRPWFALFPLLLGMTSAGVSAEPRAGVALAYRRQALPAVVAMPATMIYDFVQVCTNNNGECAFVALGFNEKLYLMSNGGLGRPALPVAESCGIVRQAAPALPYAHERGLVQRDVKPDNRMLSGTPGGGAVVALSAVEGSKKTEWAAAFLSSGMSVRFSDAAAIDMHNALGFTGLFQPDGRDIAPTLALDTSPRTGTLADFLTTKPGGAWRGLATLYSRCRRWGRGHPCQLEH